MQLTITISVMTEDLDAVDFNAVGSFAKACLQMNDKPSVEQEGIYKNREIVGQYEVRLEEAIPPKRW